MHAKRFSSVRHNTQGFAGDASSLGFRADAFDEEGSVFIICGCFRIGFDCI
jgi:hypothetical protein